MAERHNKTPISRGGRHYPRNRRVTFVSVWRNFASCPRNNILATRCARPRSSYRGHASLRPALLSFFSWGSDSGFPFFRLFYEERQEERARRQHGRRENNRRRGMMIEDGGNPAKRPVAGPPVDDASAILRAFEPTRVASDGDRAQGEGGRCARRKGKVRGRNLTLRFVLRRGRLSQLSSASSFFPCP